MSARECTGGRRHAAPRRATCTAAWPAVLAGREYLAYAGPGGTWTLAVLSRASVRTVAAELDCPHALARAILVDVFQGRPVRDDLVDAFALACDLPLAGFRLGAEFVAGWSLAWALEQEDFDA